MKSKKIIAIALTLTLVVGLTACNKDKKNETKEPTKIVDETKPTETTAPTSSTQETTTPVTPQIQVDLTKVEDELEREVKGNESYAEIRDFDVDVENGNIEIEIEVEQGLSQGDAEQVANTIYDKLNEIIKKYNTTMTTNYPAHIEVEEDGTDTILFQKLYQ
ncbi:hypothetical protein [Miniphocaeibacter massiliensis]|uniref:hypothetical protein n=1 Tax=Miniphocaeibacter massiliensis TaxID=2041841 RepID=UPI000C06E1A8|nr:hypothetical protein [Miniphocaeibacter massiliensis]